MILLSKKKLHLLLELINFHFFGLIEHKIKDTNCSRIINSMFPCWSFVHNSALAPIGRICVVWDPSMLSLSVVSQSSQAIHCSIQFASGITKFNATFVYGF